MPQGIETAQGTIAPAVAGIDEAGYGPVLGPLVVGCACFQPAAYGVGEDDGTANRLARLLADAGMRVGDSKKIYGSRGLAGLEEVVLAAACVIGGGRIDTLERLADVVAPAISIEPIPWYEGWRELPLPAAAGSARVAAATARLAGALGRDSFKMRAEILTAKRFNEQVARLGNKSDLLFDLCGRHLVWIDRMVRDRRAVRITCDKLGGRKFYRRPLTNLLDGRPVEVVVETPVRSHYRIGRMEIAFEQEADAAYPCVGLASMLAKYLREIFLLLFNRWWCREVPGLEPTAGYWTDGIRFLSDVARRRSTLGIPDRDLIRTR